MVIRILVGLAVCALAIFILFWVLTGGFSRALAIVRGLDNPLSAFSGTSTGSTLRLPWQPETVVPGADLSDLSDGNSDKEFTPEEKNKQAQEAKTFGTPSPYRGQITFTGHDFGESNQNAEYLQLQANYRNTAPVTLSCWTIQSAVSGSRISIPQAASPFISGVLNNVIPVTLGASEYATIVSGPSPVGVSFRENTCTGYLAELQTFAPNLEIACPAGGGELPVNTENIQIYGEACIDYVKNIPQCHFPGTNQSANVSNACKEFAANVLSYNGCVNRHKGDAGFATKSWRLYFASGVELWGNSHDVIRLLDDHGRTVDVLTY